MKPCECLAMIAADKVFREEGTHKCHIAGTFSVIHAPKFPVTHDAIHVYLAISDALPGDHEGRIVFSYCDEEETKVIRVQGPISIRDKLQVVELNFCFRNVVFPKPGFPCSST